MVSEAGNLLIFPRGRREKGQPEVTPEVRDKSAKTFFVNEHGQVLILVRSEKENSRVGEGDIPGGKFEENDTDAKEVAKKEARQELPGIVIRHLEPIYRHYPKEPENGVLWVRHFFAGIAEFPEGIRTSDEHDDDFWLKRSSLSAIRLPNHYMTAETVGAPVLDRLVELCQPANAHLIATIGRSAMEIDQSQLAVAA